MGTYTVEIVGAFAGAVFSFFGFLAVDAYSIRQQRWRTFRRVLSKLDYQFNDFYNASITWKRLLKEFAEAPAKKQAVVALPRPFELDPSIRGELQHSPWADEELIRGLFAFETDVRRTNHDISNIRDGYENILVAHWTSERVTPEVFLLQAAKLASGAVGAREALLEVDEMVLQLWARTEWAILAAARTNLWSRWRLRRLVPSPEEVKKLASGKREALLQDQKKSGPGRF